MVKINIMEKKIFLFVSKYIEPISDEFKKLDTNKFKKISKLILKTIKNKKTIYVCGNGGSSAISNHYICDYLKLIRHNTKFKPKVISLTSNNELLSAISNDINYDEVFKYQLESLGEKNDLVIFVSSSGNSKNVINAAKYCKKKIIRTISFTGFNGGKLKKLTDLNLHINLNSYGQVEDSHHILMHMIMHHIIKKNKNISKLRI